MARKVALILIVALVMGTLINLLVAWTCALLVSPDPAASGLDPSHLNVLRREFFERPGPDPGGIEPGTLFVSVAHVRPGVTFMDVQVVDADLGSDPFRGPLPYIAVTRAGWPMHCLECELHHDASRSPTPLPPQVKGGHAFWGWYVRGNRLFVPRMLPWRPLWPGLAVGIAFWTLITALLWLGPVGIIRLVRWRRWRCTACGYPIGASTVCTECGRTVRRRAAFAPGAESSRTLN